MDKNILFYKHFAAGLWLADNTATASHKPGYLILVNW